MKEKEGRKQRLQTNTSPISYIVPIAYIPPQQASYGLRRLIIEEIYSWQAPTST